MSDEDLFAEMLRGDRRSLSAAAPPPRFQALWRDVNQRRTEQLEAQVALLARLPAVLLFALGAIALFVQGGWHVALPCWGVAFLLVFQGLSLDLGSHPRPAVRA